MSWFFVGILLSKTSLNCSFFFVVDLLTDRDLRLQNLTLTLVRVASVQSGPVVPAVPQYGLSVHKVQGDT